MADYRALERDLERCLQLTRRPFAVAFLDEPPQAWASERAQAVGVRVLGAGRGWAGVLHGAGGSLQLPIGSYTHHIDLPRIARTSSRPPSSLMADLAYALAEVPRGAEVDKTAGGHRVFALGDTPTGARRRHRDRDGPGPHAAARRRRANGIASTSLLGRLPAWRFRRRSRAESRRASAASANALYRARGTRRFYSVIRADKLAPIAGEIATITAANVMLTQYIASDRRRLRLSRLRLKADGHERHGRGRPSGRPFHRNFNAPVILITPIRRGEARTAARRSRQRLQGRDRATPDRAARTQCRSPSPPDTPSPGGTAARSARARAPGRV